MYLKKSTIVRHTVMLLVIPLTLMSTGYALFSQNLSINTNANNPSYSAPENMRLTYTKTITASGSNWLYTIDATVQNISSTHSVSAWQAQFSLPTDFASVTCTSATCSQSNYVNTANNTGSNGNISPNSSVTFSFTFISAQPNYVFTSLSVSGTIAPIYQTISGLTVNAVAGAQTKSKNTYTWPYTITVTNNSSQDLAGWEMLIPWSSTESVSSMPTTVNYVVTSTQLQITSTQPINMGATFQFVANLSSTNSGWVMSGYSILGDTY